MKKILLMMAIFFAFAIEANAQENVAELAKKAEIATLAQTQKLQDFLKLSDDKLVLIKDILSEKNKIAVYENLSQDRRDIIAETVITKLEKVLTKAEYAKLKADTGLFKAILY